MKIGQRHLAMCDGTLILLQIEYKSELLMNAVEKFNFVVIT